MRTRPEIVIFKTEDLFNEQITLSLYYGVSINKGRRESLIDEAHNE